MNHIDLQGKRALVTGGSSGMGLAVAKRLLASGADVEIWGRDGHRLSAAVAELQDLGTVSASAVDVTDFSSVKIAADNILERQGKVDILVNCAGASPGIVPMTELTIEIWRENLALNLDSVFHCCSAFLPGMIESGWGRVVNISSMAGKEGNPYQSAYSAAKGGVLAFTKSVAKELATTGVTVNAIAPGLFDTPMLRAASSENADAVRIAQEKIPMKRVGKPEEAASLVAWIASDECSFTTGFTFDLSGGRATY